MNVTFWLAMLFFSAAFGLAVMSREQRRAQRLERKINLVCDFLTCWAVHWGSDPTAVRGELRDILQKYPESVARERP